MTTHHRWLRDEVARWLADGLVDATLAQRILARYPDAGERGWGRIAFSIIGAALVGLGVILFFAYNWQDLPKAAKLALVFLALLGAHAGALVAARREPPNQGLVEGLHALGTMLFGAGIWLVAQIYHIDEHYPTAFLVWSLGALALAWAMPSIVHGLLALALVALWSGLELTQFGDPKHVAPLFVAAGVLPLAWWRRSPALLFCAVAMLFVVVVFAIGPLNERVHLPLLTMLAVAAFAAGVAAPLTAFPGASRPLRAIGLLVAIGCCFPLSFPFALQYVGAIPFAHMPAGAYFAGAAVLLVGALGAVAVLVARNGWAEISPVFRAQLGLLVAALAVVLIAVFARERVAPWALALPCNLILLGLAASLIFDGSARLLPSRVGAGCLVFAAVAISRYADLFTSLLARATVFVLLGAGLFAVGNFYARQRRRVRPEQP